MSAELTPLERLDEAVREFAETAGDPGTVAGWVLGYQLTAFTDEPGRLPLVSRPEYTMSPATTGELGLGIARLTAGKIEREILDCLDADTDD